MNRPDFNFDEADVRPAPTAEALGEMAVLPREESEPTWTWQVIWEQRTLPLGKLFGGQVLLTFDEDPLFAVEVDVWKPRTGESLLLTMPRRKKPVGLGQPTFWLANDHLRASLYRCVTTYIDAKRADPTLVPTSHPILVPADIHPPLD